MIVPLPLDPSALVACTPSDKLPGLAEVARGVTALARAGESRLLVASGPVLFDLDTTDPEHPAPRAWLALSAPLRALRADAIGGRAYCIGGIANQPIFDLRSSALEETGTHDVAFWVERRETDDLRLRHVLGHAELAEVAP